MRNITITVCSLICLFMPVLLFGCGGGNSSAPTGPNQYGSLQFAVASDKTSYSPGEQVSITFSVKNVGIQPVQTNYPNGVVYITNVIHDNQLVWWVPQVTIPEPQELTLAPGETKTFTDIWNQMTPDGVSLPPGNYTVKSWLDAATINSAPVSNAQTQLAAKPITISITSSQ